MQRAYRFVCALVIVGLSTVAAFIGTAAEETPPVNVAGSVRIVRVGQDLKRWSAPVTDAWIKDLPLFRTRPAPNPVQYNGLAAPGMQRVFVSQVPGYTVAAATCDYSVAALPDERCALDQDDLTSDGVTCNDRKCWKDTAIKSGYVTKVVFQFSKKTVEQPYNIVVLMTDDQRWDTIDMQVDGRWVMPAVRTLLVDQGVQFSNAFVTTPLCCPSRASLLSGGFYAKDTGVLDNAGPNGGFAAFDDTRSMPVALQRAGYHTALIGKYLNGYDDTNAGPDAPSTTKYIPPGWDKLVTPLVYRWNAFNFIEGASTPDAPGKGEIKDSTTYQTYFLRDQALAFLETQRNSPAPFFLYFAPQAPHSPATPAPEDKGKFSAYTFRSASFNEADMSDKPTSVQKEAKEYQEDLANHDEFHRNQLRSLQAVDRAVDAIMSKVKALDPQLDHTAVFFASDNGFLWGDHNLNAKGRAYEESVRVPFVVRMPGVKPRKDEHIVAANIDIGPTINELAGLSRRTNGASLVALLRNPVNAPWRKELFLEGYRRIDAWAALRTTHWKYVEYVSGEKELYDMVNDPHELQSLHNQPAHQDMMADLSARLSRQKGVLITSRSAPKGVVDQPYFYQARAWGGQRLYTWSIASGSLPEGLRLDPAAGVIRGTPRQVETRSMVLRVEDASIARYTRKPKAFAMNLTIEIKPSGTSPLPPADGVIIGGFTNVNGKTCSVEGWAINIYRQGRKMHYEIYLDGPEDAGSYIGNGVAGGPMPAIGSDPDYRGDHGFAFTLPATHKDARRHHIYAYAVDKKTGERAIFEGAPQAIICAP